MTLITYISRVLGRCASKSSILKFSKRNHYGTWFLLPGCLIIIMQLSCKKYLDEKPDKKLAVPSTLADLQAILESAYTMLTQFPPLSVVAGDEYTLNTSAWANLTIDARNNAVWDPQANDEVSWNNTYKIVYYANVVLQELPGIIQFTGNSNPELADNIRGQALFYRAIAFYHLAQLYCKPYSNNANADPGIPLRTVPDIEEPSVRSTVQETYNMIIDDLGSAASLMPIDNQTIFKPNKIASFGALARVYLSMRNYANAGRFADSALKLHSTLLDYSTLDSSAAAPFSRFTNPEVIFSIMMSTHLLIPSNVVYIPDSIINSFHENDLRKVLFFTTGTEGRSFKGSYFGNVGYFPFCGIATDELYLIRSECAARAGLKDSAMNDINRLLLTRWKKKDGNSTYVNMTAATVQEALEKVLQERGKELIFRGTRWTDCRRFNEEGANITLRRDINGTIYTLLPNDPRWVMLIPFQVINLSGMKQNPR